MYLLLYVHVCVTRTGWKTRPRPKTVILPIKKSNQIKSLSPSSSLSLPSYHSPLSHSSSMSLPSYHSSLVRSACVSVLFTFLSSHFIRLVCFVFSCYLSCLPFPCFSMYPPSTHPTQPVLLYPSVSRHIFPLPYLIALALLNGIFFIHQPSPPPPDPPPTPPTPTPTPTSLSSPGCLVILCKFSHRSPFPSPLPVLSFCGFSLRPPTPKLPRPLVSQVVWRTPRER